MIGWIIASVLAGADILLSVAVVCLLRSQDRLMRVISAQYRAESDPPSTGRGHYSMYSTEGDKT